MINYVVISLEEFIKEFGTPLFRRLIKDFETKKDLDVQHFLLERALLFDKIDLCRTYLIINTNDESIDRSKLAGYFSISNNKAIDVSDVNEDSKKELFGSEEAGYINRNQEGVFLIGQIGRNDQYEHDELPGDKILDEIYLVIADLVKLAGGRFMMLECKSKLRKHYESWGFTYFKTNNHGQKLDVLLRRTNDININEKVFEYN